jgi:hypothetical protein
VEDATRQVDPARDGTSLDALQHALISRERDVDGEVRVGGGDDREGADRGDVERRGAHLRPGDGHLLVSEQRGEDHEEHQGEREREEGIRRIPPEGLVREAHLLPQQAKIAHPSTPASPPVISR